MFHDGSRGADRRGDILLAEPVKSGRAQPLPERPSSVEFGSNHTITLGRPRRLTKVIRGDDFSDRSSLGEPGTKRLGHNTRGTIGLGRWFAFAVEGIKGGDRGSETFPLKSTERQTPVCGEDQQRYGCSFAAKRMASFRPVRALARSEFDSPQVDSRDGFSPVEHETHDVPLLPAQRFFRTRITFGRPKCSTQRGHPQCDNCGRGTPIQCLPRRRGRSIRCRQGCGGHNPEDLSAPGLWPLTCAGQERRQIRHLPNTQCASPCLCDVRGIEPMEHRPWRSERHPNKGDRGSASGARGRVL